MGVTGFDGLRPPPKLTTALILLMVVFGGADALRRLELTVAEGDVSGNFAFAEGEAEASCKACRAVMEHVQDALDHSAGSPGTPEATRRVRSAQIHAVLDPRSCRAAMSNFSLVRQPIANVAGRDELVFRTGADAAAVAAEEPISTFAQQDLMLFCETMLEEYEEELAALLSTDVSRAAEKLPQLVCSTKLSLCTPLRRPKYQKERSAKSRSERTRLHAAHLTLDRDRNGFLSLTELAEWVETITDPRDKSGPIQESALKALYARLDTNKDGGVSMREFILHWPRQAMSNLDMGSSSTSNAGEASSGEPTESSTSRSEAVLEVLRVVIDVLARVMRLMVERPLIMLPVIATTTMCMYVGGLVFRLWE